MNRKPAVSIERMLDEVFHKDIDDELIDEIAESRTFILETLKKFIHDDEMWEMFHNSDDKLTGRKLFLENLQELFLQEDETNLLIELVTFNQEEK